jgi:xanthine dehydrogenase accessory factor
VSANEVDLPRPAAASPVEVLAKVAALHDSGVDAVLATVTARRGSAPATPGQKLALAADGTCVGTLGGGALERHVLEAMQKTLASMREGTGSPSTHGPQSMSVSLGAALGMCCGGSVDVLVEPMAAAWPILLVGAGHVATATAPLLARAGFAFTVCDEREEWAAPSRIESARVICGTYRDGALKVPRRGAFLVMTHDHALDQEAIEWALREKFAFVGGIGSRAKAARMRTRLEAREFDASDIARVRMPLGVHIGARSPDEIAIAVTAEMIAWRRGVELAVTDHGTKAAPASSGARSPTRLERS